MACEAGHDGLQRSAPEDARRPSLWDEISPFGRGRERLGFFRLCMVVVSFAPLFLLIAVRGNDVVGEIRMWLGCLSLVFVPMVVVVARIVIVWRTAGSESIVVGQADDSRPQVLSYLFATMLPFYRSSVEGWRDLAALAVALVVILWLFWSLRWHYVNWMLLLAGYRVYTVTPPGDPVGWGRRTLLVLITRRGRPLSGERVLAKRVSDTVYWETGT